MLLSPRPQVLLRQGNPTRRKNWAQATTSTSNRNGRSKIDVFGYEDHAHYEPLARCRHVAAAVGDKLYLWRGMKRNACTNYERDKNATIDVLDLQQWTWQEQTTIGVLPPGVRGCGFTVVGKRIITYGGYSGDDCCFHNSLHELDTTSLTWTELAPNELEGAPMKKGYCGLVAYSSGGDEQLCVFGGYGTLNSATRQPTAQYTESSEHTGQGYTNETHCFLEGELA